MSECQVPSHDVNHEDTIDIDVDTLIPHNKLLLYRGFLIIVVPLGVFSNIDIHISDIKLVFPTYQEHFFFESVSVINV